MGSLKGGAQKSRLGQLSSLTEAVDEGEEGVELKLHCARLLKQARHLGLHRRLVSFGHSPAVVELNLLPKNWSGPFRDLLLATGNEWRP
jgi:hypothetical protein